MQPTEHGELEISELGPDRVEYHLPPQPRDPLLLGCLTLPALGLAGLVMVGVWVAKTAGAHPDDSTLAPLAFFALAAIPVIAVGGAGAFLGARGLWRSRRRVSLSGGRLRVTEHTGPLWHTRSWRLSDLRHLRVMPHPFAIEEDLAVLHAEPWDGEEPLVVAERYPRALLTALAADLSQRATAYLQATTPGHAAPSLPWLDVDEDPTEHDLRPPPGRRAAVRERGPDRLVLALRPQGLRAPRQVWIQMLLSLPFLGFGALLLLGSLATLVLNAGGQNVWIAALIGTAFLGAGLGFGGSSLIRICRRAVVELDAEQLTLRQSVFGITRTRRWPRREIKRLAVSWPTGGREGTPVFHLLLICRDGHEEKLLHGRRRPELEWLVGEVSRAMETQPGQDPIEAAWSSWREWPWV